ncbi:hypothetical protein [Micrococcus terreus]|uniref:Uncharacterized protein n=1 Tax=Micrococcus terreus TaxID=574650 RepID=A0A1I7MHC9_9MICC|nr:hypothetical protein [Micrococcus terreus]SFV21325.1 hypothetical protein SAMN04487966_102297 [Micrococcus terreus]
MRDNTVETLTEVLGSMDDRQEQAEAVFAALRSNDRTRKRARTLTYRCPNTRRCALAEVYSSPVGVLIHHPHFKMSPKLNAATSSEEGRRANTLDGDRHWKARTYFLEAALNLTLSCDHIHDALIDREQVTRDIKAGHAEVIVTA